MFLEYLVPEARMRRIAIGQRHASEDTLALAWSLLQSYDAHAALLAEHAFALEDGALLRQCAVELQSLGITRDTATTAKAGAARERVAAEKEAKRGRRQGRALLVACREAAVESATVEAATVKAITDALHATADFGVDNATLSRQLQALVTALAHPGVTELAKTRGGPRLAEHLPAIRTRLDAADENRPHKPGTPVETETLDIVDGTIVLLARRLRRAARNADEERGGDALSKLFTLDAIQGRKPPKIGEAPSEPGVATA